MVRWSERTLQSSRKFSRHAFTHLEKISSHTFYGRKRSLGHIWWYSGLLLILQSRVTPGCFGETMWELKLKPRWVACRANTWSAVLFLIPTPYTFILDHGRGLLASSPFELHLFLYKYVCNYGPRNYTNFTNFILI